MVEVNGAPVGIPLVVSRIGADGADAVVVADAVGKYVALRIDQRRRVRAALTIRSPELVDVVLPPTDHADLV
jgi:hypothetical protein